jgi:hypothetical protein
MRSILRSGLLFLALVACGPGAAYDNLSGGAPPAKTATEDDALVAPRPTSPISVSTVSTSRPRFKWQLFGASTGAIVELSRTRAFDGDVKSYPGQGSELVVPEDLELGFWFWRLKSTTPDTVGTKTSPVWEVLVRGPAAHGSSDAPVGAILDLNGDGKSDFVTVADAFSDDPSDPKPYPTLFPYLGNDERRLEMDEAAVVAGFPFGPPHDAPLPVTVAGGTDMDGDGLADVAFGAYDVAFGGYVNIFPGDAQKTIGLAMYIAPVLLGTTAGLREAGDTDGDGYGDYLVSDAGNVALALGGVRGPRASASYSIVSPDVMKGFKFSTPPVPLAGGFDADGDGFSDLAMGFVFDSPARRLGAPKLDGHFTMTTPTESSTPSGSSAPNDDPQASPMRFYTGGVGTIGTIADRPLAIKNVNVSTAVPIAFANGDFNGDGRSDMAASVAFGRKRRVCFWYGDATKGFVPGSCVVDDGSDGTLGNVMTAADLEGDGVDELLVSSSANGGSVTILKAEQEIAVAGHVSNLGSTALTTIYPGRPGPARWAALSADGGSIRVFEGTSERQRIAPLDMTQGFGRAMR